MLEDLIPLESSTEQHGPDKKRWQDRLIIGHNVGFDRSFVKEQYYLKVSGKYYTILSRDTVLYRPRQLNQFTTSVFYGKSPQKKNKICTHKFIKKKYEVQSSMSLFQLISRLLFFVFIDLWHRNIKLPIIQ